MVDNNELVGGGRDVFLVADVSSAAVSIFKGEFIREGKCLLANTKQTQFFILNFACEYNNHYPYYCNSSQTIVSRSDNFG